MRDVAIFGGAFNPPHLAHVFTMTYLLGRTDVDEVWLIPTAAHVFGKDLAPLDRRIAMLTTIVDGYGWSDRVRVLDVEGRREGPSRTFDTLTELSEAYPEYRFRWVIGADNLTERHRWYRFDDLVARWNLIVLGRPGHESALADCSTEVWCDPGPTMPSISSTEIRAALRQGGGGDILRWLPSNILDVARREYPPVVYEGPSVTVFGYGRTGRSLSAALRQRGISVSTWNRSPDTGADLSGELPAEAPSGLWLLTVSDDAIEPLAARLAETYGALTDVTVFHCAGRHDISILSRLGAQGAALGVFHPIQALLGQADDLKDAWCVVAGETAVLETAKALAGWVGGRYVHRTGHDAQTYHAAAVLTANFVSTLLKTGVELMGRVGIQAESAKGMLVSLLEGTIHNLASKPPEEALTGPFARKDFDAMRSHCHRLRHAAPEALPVYQALGFLTAQMMDWSDEEMELLVSAVGQT